MEIRTFGSSSSGNCYLLKDGDSSLLLEAGINPSKMKIDWTLVDGILITHEHKDHSKFASKLIKRTRADVYCTRGTSNFLDVPLYRTKILKAKESIRIKGWQILPFDTEHDVAEPVGFLIQSPSGAKILFATDTYLIQYQFAGLTHIMIECNYDADLLRENVDSGRVHLAGYKRIMRSHYDINHVIDFLGKNDLSKLQEIHLLHLSDRNSDEDNFKQRIQAVTGVPVYVAR